MDQITHPLNACTLISDFERRDIAPDKTVAVTQGTLLLWLVCNSFAAMVRLHDNKTTARGIDLYINTTTPQEIAGDVLRKAQ